MAENLQQRLSAIRKQIREVEPDELTGRMIFDVRESDEVSSGKIPDAITVPRGLLELKIEELVPSRATAIAIYCAGGTRSLLAAADLAQMGYHDVVSLAGGIKRWKDTGRGLEKTGLLSAGDQQRYAAQLRLPQVGEAGQAKLRAAKVLIVGAGGLGSPVAFYLAAAGVGTIGLIDDDVIDASNLQRQILHTTDRIGLAKVDSAQLTLKNLNPGIQIKTYKSRLDIGNVDEVIPDYDIIVDGCDNFQTRYLVNDACLNHRKLNVHGSVFWFEGQASVFCAPDGPCYRCLFEEAPSAELAPNCAEAGVLGVLPGSIGLLEATEVIKLILGIGTSLVGRLLTYDALAAEFREMKIRKNPNCSACSQPGRIAYQTVAESCSAPTAKRQ